MNLEDVKEVLYDVSAQYFAGASVIWTKQSATKPKPPYVTLEIEGGINRAAFPVTDEDGNICYQCSTRLEVNIYTKGRPVIIESHVTGNYANTALNDMSAFANYMESEAVTDFLAENGMAISLMPPVRDLTGLENENTSYRYRSMAEFTVSYTEDANGMFGIYGTAPVPDYSGGGTQEMADTPIEAIEEVEIEYGGGTDNEE